MSTHPRQPLPLPNGAIASVTRVRSRGRPRFAFSTRPKHRVDPPTPSSASDPPSFTTPKTGRRRPYPTPPSSQPSSGETTSYPLSPDSSDVPLLSIRELEEQLWPEDDTAVSDRLLCDPLSLAVLSSRKTEPSDPQATSSSSRSGFTRTNTCMRKYDSMRLFQQQMKKHVVSIGKLPRFFDALPHDYNVVKQRVHRDVVMGWQGTPGIKAEDIRARHFKPSLPNPSGIFHRTDIILRSSFRCNGSCRRIIPVVCRNRPAEEELMGWAKGVRGRQKRAQIQLQLPFEGNEGDDWLEEALLADRTAKEKEEKEVSPIRGPSEEEEEDPDDIEEYSDHSDGESESSEQSHGRHPKGKPRFRCSEWLFVEITVEQLEKGECTIYTAKSERHPSPADLAVLRTSPYMRRLLHEVALTFSMTPGTISIWLETVKQRDRHAELLRDDFPHRLPNKATIRSALKAAQSRVHRDRDQLLSIQLMAESHPEAFICYSYPDVFGNDVTITLDSRWECIVAPDSALDFAILYALDRGMGCDSSWRNKNAYGCPLTLLIVVNENGHMIPVAAMVSNHADTEAYRYLFDNFSEAVRHRAKKIASGQATSTIRGDADQLDRFRRNCNIIAEDGFEPLFLMIDGDDAERGAGQGRWPECPIRMCQFHLMQACRARVRAILGQFESAEWLTEKILEALRRAQRCKEEESWLEYYTAFKREVLELIDNDEKSWNVLDQYLRQEWFSKRWLRSTTDIGLPPFVTRDGPWSTNNYAEAAFRVFDKVFLGCRVNRRLDRLVHILAFVYFPYYRQATPADPSLNTKLAEALRGGLSSWESDSIRRIPPERLPVAIRDLYQHPVYAVRGTVPGTSGQSVHFAGLSITGRGYDCDCGQWEQTLQTCKHLWAVAVFERCGRVTEQRKRQEAISNQAPEQITTNKDDTEIDDEKDFTAYWNFKSEVLCAENGLDFDTTRQAPQQPILPAIKSLTGRPSNIRPLHPHRTKSKRKQTPRSKELALVGDSRPRGMINTGVDCYALSLFQCLYHSESWISITTGSWSERLAPLCPSQVAFKNFCEAVDCHLSISATAMPNLRKDLCADLPLEGSPSSPDPARTQQDPVEVLEMLLQRWDEEDLTEGYSNLFGTTVNQSSVCQLCSRASGAVRDSVKTVIQLHQPAAALNSAEPLPLQSWILDSLQAEWGQLRPQHIERCSHQDCSQNSIHSPNSRIASTGSLMALQLPYWQDTIGQEYRDTFRTPIPVTFKLPKRQSAEIPSTSSEWSIRGIICRVGLSTEVGHYVALVLKGTRWWIIDDEKVKQGASTVEATREGRYPVLLLYAKSSEETKAKLTAAPTAAARFSQQRDRLKLAGFKSSTGQLFVKRPSDESMRDLRKLVEVIAGHLAQSSMKAPSKLWPGNSLWHVQDFADFFFGQKWFQMDLNILLCELKMRAIRARATASKVLAKENQKSSSPREFVRELYTCNPEPIVIWKDRTKTLYSWPQFGPNEAWRGKYTISIVGVAAYHYVVILVAGPQKTTVIFDGYGGAGDVSAIKKKWTSLLKDRLDWELEQGMVKREDNEGWLFGPNTQANRKALNWVEQTDTVSCGPLAVLATHLLLDGFIPQSQMLGLAQGRVGQLEGSQIRLQLLFFLLQEVSQDRHVIQLLTPSERSLLLAFLSSATPKIVV